MKNLYQISGKYFCAGLEVNENGSVVNCAPILRKWCMNQHIAKVKKICKSRGLEIILVKKPSDAKNLFFVDD